MDEFSDPRAIGRGREDVLRGKIDPWQENQREKQRMAQAQDARPGSISADVSPIEVARTNAARQEAELMKALEELRARLGPVLRPSEPGPGRDESAKVAAERAKCEIAHSFDSLALGSLASLAIAADILRRLEL